MMDHCGHRVSVTITCLILNKSHEGFLSYLTTGKIFCLYRLTFDTDRRVFRRSNRPLCARGTSVGIVMGTLNSTRCTHIPHNHHPVSRP